MDYADVIIVPTVLVEKLYAATVQIGNFLDIRSTYLYNFTLVFFWGIHLWNFHFLLLNTEFYLGW